MNTYDRRPYEVYEENKARVIELEIRRLIYERGDMSREQWLIHRQNKARLDELDRREAIPL